MEFVGTELIFIHLFLSLPLIIPPLWNLLNLFSKKSHTKKLHTLAVIAPAYYTLLSACAFSGFVIWAMLGFVFTFKILLMLVLWLVVLVTEIKRHKRQKLILVEADSKKRDKFFTFTICKYSFDCICIILLMAFWFI